MNPLWKVGSGEVSLAPPHSLPFGPPQPSVAPFPTSPNPDQVQGKPGYRCECPLLLYILSFSDASGTIAQQEKNHNPADRRMEYGLLIFNLQRSLHYASPPLSAPAASSRYLLYLQPALCPCFTATKLTAHTSTAHTFTSKQSESNNTRKMQEVQSNPDCRARR